jgi:NADPH:quinone reductase-like Zn-dependent oxidoreductase
MHALRYERFGPVAEVARWTDLPDPAPGAGQVRVRIAWASINPLDWKLVEGQFRWFARSRPPCGVGAEFSGVIDALGPGVTAPAVGTRVLALLNPFIQPPGALQTQALLPAAEAIRVPDAVALDAASTLAVAGMSALQMCRLADLRPGQRVLVHGAAGGVGSYAVQVVRALGATAVATGSTASQDFIATLGAAAHLDYTRRPPSSWGGPFDAVLDCASSLAPADAGALLGRRGRYVATLPRLPGAVLDPLLNPLRARQRRTLRLQPSTADLATLMQWLADGRLEARISARLPADDAVQALALSKGGRVRGKLVVRLDAAA